MSSNDIPPIKPPTTPPGHPVNAAGQFVRDLEDAEIDAETEDAIANPVTYQAETILRAEDYRRDNG